MDDFLLSQCRPDEYILSHRTCINMSYNGCLQSSEILKRFAQRVTTSSSKERIGLLHSVTECVGRSGE